MNRSSSIQNISQLVDDLRGRVLWKCFQNCWQNFCRVLKRELSPIQHNRDRNQQHESKSVPSLNLIPWEPCFIKPKLIWSCDLRRGRREGRRWLATKRSIETMNLHSKYRHHLKTLASTSFRSFCRQPSSFESDKPEEDRRREAAQDNQERILIHHSKWCAAWMSQDQQYWGINWLCKYEPDLLPSYFLWWKRDEEVHWLDQEADKWLPGKISLLRLSPQPDRVLESIHEA